MMNLFGCSFLYLALLIQAFQYVHLVMNRETEQKGMLLPSINDASLC